MVRREGGTVRWWALWRGVRRVRPLSAPRGRVVRRRARAFSSLASIVPVANGTAGSSQGARSAARRHTAAHRWRGGTQRTRAIGVEKVERLANLLLLLLRERLLGLGGRPFRGGHSRVRAVALTVLAAVGIATTRNSCARKLRAECVPSPGRLPGASSRKRGYPLSQRQARSL